LSEQIAISFTYSRAEYIRAMRHHYRNILRVRLDVAIAAILIGTCSGLVYLQGVSAIGLFGIFTGITLLSIIVYAWFILPRLIYKSQPKLKQPYELIFSDTGILFRTAGIDSRLDWSIYRKWTADNECYILYYGKRFVSVIPRRAFPDDSVDHIFHEMLVREIGDFGKSVPPHDRSSDSPAPIR
jgi:hypothetical protein